MQDQVRPLRIHGVHSRFTWTHFCVGMLLASGAGLALCIANGLAMAIPLAIVFGFAMLSVTLLER